ncbi:RDD family protein [Aestuariimicrobium soli]|uniref:RDD family protein n=1 Tax=Aestuariimicrobium soli TaxID=2035834 RepID=UPI003EBBC035
MAKNMPTGVQVAPLWRRVVALLIDSVVPALLVVAQTALASRLDSSQVLVTTLVTGIIGLAWFVLLWWSYGTRGAGPGYRLMGLQLVGLLDGKPLGWGRWIVRQLVFAAVGGTGVGLIALLIFLVIHERRQGWHDLAGKAVAIRSLASASEPRQRTTATQTRAHSTTVALPPHLVAAAFDGSAHQNYGQQGDGQAYGQQPYGQQGPGGAPGGGGPSSQQPSAHAAAGVTEDTGWRPPPRPGSQPATGAPSGWGQAPSSAPPQHQEPNPPQSAPSANPMQETAVRVVQREALPEDDEYGTRLAPARANVPSRPGHQGWFVQLDDGRRVPVEGKVLIGRRPNQPTDGTTATLVEVGEGGHAISKVHLALGVDARGLYVTDLGSTNGTALVNQAGELDPCQPGVQTRVREGQTVSFGDRSLVVMRQPAL